MRNLVCEKKEGCAKFLGRSITAEFHQNSQTSHTGGPEWLNPLLVDHGPLMAKTKARDKGIGSHPLPPEDLICVKNKWPGGIIWVNKIGARHTSNKWRFSSDSQWALQISFTYNAFFFSGVFVSLNRIYESYCALNSQLIAANRSKPISFLVINRRRLNHSWNGLIARFHFPSP